MLDDHGNIHCDECGRFIAYQDILDGRASLEIVEHWDYSGPDEEHQALCAQHNTEGE